ncbi:hypothetical protein D3C76_1445530 [compost metagenome]
MIFLDRFALRLLFAIREIAPPLLLRTMTLPPTRIRMAYNLTILDSDDPIGRLGDFFVMCNHHDRLIEFLTHLFEEDHNLLTCFAVKVSRRLIG